MLDWRNAFPETAKDWAVRNANVLRAVVIFGTWLIAFLMLLCLASIPFAESYVASCILSLMFTMHMKQSGHPHLAGGVKNDVLESDANMQDRQSRWLHDSLIQYFCFGVYMAPWAALWIYANWISPILS